MAILNLRWGYFDCILGRRLGGEDIWVAVLGLRWKYLGGNFTLEVRI